MYASSDIDCGVGKSTIVYVFGSFGLSFWLLEISAPLLDFSILLLPACPRAASGNGT